MTRTKGRSLFSFAYAQTWLELPYAQTLDPDLQLYSGAQYLQGKKPALVSFWIPLPIDELRADEPKKENPSKRLIIVNISTQS